MTRCLCYGLSAAPAPPSGPLLRFTVKPGVKLQTLVREVPIESLRPAFAVFAALDGTAPANRVDITGPEEFTIALAPEIAVQPWRLAILALLIDNAFFDIESPTSSAFLKAVVMEVDSHQSITADALLSALDTRKAAAEATMTKWLPADFELAAPYQGRVFPVDGLDWMFEMTLQPATTLSYERAERLRGLIEDCDSIMAWTGFETENPPFAFLENGLIPYPSEVEVKGGKISYMAEMPPSGCGLMFDMMISLVAKDLGAPVTSVDIKIVEGW